MAFTPGVNVIIGPSDCGKSAVIRALRWLVWNRPTGDEFRSSWGGDTRVEIELEEDIIARFKSKEILNGYSINTKVLSAFGTDIPKEIHEALNLDEINLQQQHDSPFLLSSSPGEVSAFFNRIAHLESIDRGLKYLAGLSRKLSIRQEEIEERKLRTEEELQRFEYLDKFEVELEGLELMEGSRNAVMNSGKALSKLIFQLNAVNSDLEETSEITKHERAVSRVLGMYEEREKVERNHETLELAIEDAERVEMELSEARQVAKLHKPVQEILDMYEEREKLQTELSKLSTHSEHLRDVDNALIDVGLELRDHEELFHKTMPATCPLCGSKTKKS